MSSASSRGDNSADTTTESGTRTESACTAASLGADEHQFRANALFDNGRERLGLTRIRLDGEDEGHVRS